MSRSFRTGLLSLIRRVFGTPKGRHVIGAAPAPELPPVPEMSPAPLASPAPAIAPAPEVFPAPALSPASLPPEAQPRTVAAEIAPSAVQAPQSDAPRIGPTSIRLIFRDGSVVSLTEGSVEGRQAQYLARRVLEAGRHS